MLVKAGVRYIRISPTKLREIINHIRGKKVNTAAAILSNVNKRAAYFAQKVLKAAAANAKVKGLNLEDMYISKITAEAGPVWKRFKAAAFGRAAKIRKRTSHLTIELDLSN